ncbi:MAG: sigma-70 family RNA polymerase sigma factor [Candidatus Poribacteria bacterium]|nr:sigma-70 family RNA polymerase sigma factor [Candidatus Poribacteria bacterium]
MIRTSAADLEHELASDERGDPEKIPANSAGVPRGKGSGWIACVSTATAPKEMSMSRSNEDLMLSAKDGDCAAFETLTKRHYINTLNFIFRFVNNRTLAEDLCQETFLRLWRSVPTYRPLAKFTTFLYHIAKNVCLKHLAKDQRIPHLSSLDEPVFDQSGSNYNLSEEIEDNRYLPDETTIAKEADEAIRTAINDLSEEHRLVFVLTELQGLSYQEVAEIAQCPIGTVASRKNAAVRQLQRSLMRYVRSAG